ncbi:hypothetical protein PORY_000980 [Pneumocystis oryctolagi]|uniref:Uncharacterized protein n=1 Tax=Pneumocystis oryctolagi TaxID=42067 RepID=A0ACB7CCF5_9ASCO|nr:hypothetical protein PORY_000980 [Pneumocystis oryctolagi]
MDIAAKNMLLNHSVPEKSTRSRRKKLNNLTISPANPQQINDIISKLSMPMRSVHVAQQYANCLNAVNYIGGVQAYAKLAGATWTYYVKALNVTIGREPDRTNPSSDSLSEFDVHIDLDLGPAKVVSRKHATIEYDLQGRFWECIIYGRNGVRIDNKLYRDNKRVKLSSGNILEIGGVQMMFVLPDSVPKISINALNYNEDDIFDKYNQVHDRKSHDIKGALFSPSRRKSYEKGSHKENLVSKYYLSTSSKYENNESLIERDLSLDSAKDIKPPYSYATMIAQAIMSTEEGKLTLSGIYSWISNNYAYYRFSKSGWQNSIRHNLSLNRAFRKVPRRADEPGKGMKWQVSPEYREELVERTKKQGLDRRIKSFNSSTNTNTSNSKMPLIPLESLTQRNKPISDPPSTPISSKYSDIRHQNEHFSGSTVNYDFHSQLFSYGNQANTTITTPPPAMSPTYPYQHTSIVRQQDSYTPERGEFISKGSASVSSNHVGMNNHLYYPTSSPAPFWRYMVSSSINNTPKKNSENNTYSCSSSPPIPASQKATVSRPDFADFDSTENILDLQGVDLAKGFENISKWRESQLGNMGITEHFPIDLLRSLQLVRQLDDESTCKPFCYIIRVFTLEACVNKLDELALTVSTDHPEQYTEMAQLLKISLQNRSITFTETCKLYKMAERHLHTVEQTLQKLEEAWLKNQHEKTTEVTYAEKSQPKKKQRRNKSETEPIYCFCNQISYGRMIACDNRNCSREWFHWDCVRITSAPKGKWTCSDKCAFAIGHKPKKKSRN